MTENEGAARGSPAAKWWFITVSARKWHYSGRLDEHDETPISSCGTGWRLDAARRQQIGPPARGDGSPALSSVCKVCWLAAPDAARVPGGPPAPSTPEEK